MPHRLQRLGPHDELVDRAVVLVGDLGPTEPTVEIAQPRQVLHAQRDTFASGDDGGLISWLWRASGECTNGLGHLIGVRDAGQA
jgi:hypothetical protein